MIGFLGRVWPLLGFIGLSCWYAIWCPFNKVEESFNTQAIHDIIYHWPDLAKFDHFEFPGVVPRTFVGAIVVGTITRTIFLASQVAGFALTKINVLIISRLVLALLSGLCWHKMQRAVNYRFGSTCSHIFAILTLVQFHPLFYSSRTLPNTFALNLVLLAYGAWFKGHVTSAIRWLTICAAIFRFEVAVLLAGVFLAEAIVNRAKTWSMIKTLLVTGLCSVATTVLVDSYFWSRWLWPELCVFYFNIIQNKSSEWGTQPMLWYLQKALPNALLLAYPFAFLGLFRSQIEKRFFVPTISFLGLFSILPHKELRFIFYIIPILNLAAASSIQALIIESHKRKNMMGIFIQLVFVGVLGLCFLSSIFRVFISSRNYPGGDAMLKVHQLYASQPNVQMHIDVETAMTGCSRFLQVNESWNYDKTENLTDEELLQFTHILSTGPVEGFKVDGAVKGFTGLRFNFKKKTPGLSALFSLIEMREDDKILILRRSDNSPQMMPSDQTVTEYRNPIGQQIEL